MRSSFLLRNRSQLAWPTAIFTSALLVGMANLFNFPPSLRVPITFWFLLICPGMAYIRLLELKDNLAEWVLAIALSLASSLVLSLAMIYTGLWKPEWGFLLLIVLSLAGAGLQVRARRYADQNR